MTRDQVIEGFRRIGVVTGTLAVIVSILVVGAFTRPLGPGGAWWPFAMWSAILFPIVWMFGAGVAAVSGWVVAGFFEQAPAPLRDEVNPFELPGAPRATRRWKRFRAAYPFMIIAAWIAAWLAADWAGTLIGDAGWLLAFIARVIAGLFVFTGSMVLYLLAETVAVSALGKK